jgi:hypothetical protein
MGSRGEVNLLEGDVEQHLVISLSENGMKSFDSPGLQAGGVLILCDNAPERVEKKIQERALWTARFLASHN